MTRCTHMNSETVREVTPSAKGCEECLKTGSWWVHLRLCRALNRRFRVANRLPLGIHAGSTYRHSITSLGWPSYYIEDYASHTQAFQSQIASLVCEGVFAKFPGLKVVLLESGVTWLPGFLWRFSKFWRGVRSEVPWVDRSPAEIVRDHVRLTIQPFDAPPDSDGVKRLIARKSKRPRTAGASLPFPSPLEGEGRVRGGWHGAEPCHGAQQAAPLPELHPSETTSAPALPS